MKKILGLDVGNKRIGIAIGDENTEMVFPRETIMVKTIRGAVDFFKNFCEKEKISKIIVGLPLDAEDQETKQSKKIRRFAEKLQGIIKLPVFFQEESFSTQEALWKMPKEKRKHRDTLAAVIILERYFTGARGRDRTDDLGLMSPTL